MSNIRQKKTNNLYKLFVFWAVKAMSFPSEGRTAMFRNPMTEVSKFMKTKDRIYPFDRIDPFDQNGLFDIDPYEIAWKLIRKSIQNIFMFGISVQNEVMKRTGLKIDADGYLLMITMSRNWRNW